MNDSARLAWGMVAAALLLALVYVGYREFDRARNMREVNEAMSEIMKLPAQFQVDQRQALDDLNRRQQSRRLSDMTARTLTADLRCVGGVVIRVNGATYTQLGRVGDPVRCAGNLADRAIR